MTQPARPPVVITRPLAQAIALQDKIARLCRDTLLFPLLEIHPLDDNRELDAALAGLERHALVAFVSPNAIDAAFARRSLWPAQVPLAVMGEGSRQALARHGITAATTRIFSPQDAERTDSQTLLAALDLPALAGQEVLIVRGQNGRELLGDALRSAGVLVRQVPAYRRAAPRLDAHGVRRLQDMLATGCDWIITSSEALQVLIEMVERAIEDPAVAAGGMSVVKLQQQTLIVPHVRIAETARALGFCNVIQSASGDEGLLAALQFTDE
ncbi:MAG: uroporphyrinogen-III synthase [Herminiimonas sp.]|nr:uroporphyrinogen-III synthase [Herminiimonas sp.]